MDGTQNSKGRSDAATGPGDGKRPAPVRQTGGKLDGDRLNDVAGGTLPAVNDPYAENF